MGIAEKPDAQRFRDHLAFLKQEQWLGTPRRWWPDYLFHHTNIDNVVKILRSGYIFARSELNLHGEEFHDSASPDVIEQTNDQWKDYVRFYFRPRTPTFYNVEGFRPKHSQKYGKQCPIPIYFLFDMSNIICRSDSRFSDRNLAIPHTQVFSTASEFEKLPFEQIYHDKWLPEGQQGIEIKRHQNAEVIVPKRIDLEHLQRIECRSKAEYDTLNYLLGDTLWRQWKDKIRVSIDKSLFHRYWTSVANVELSSSTIKFEFSCDKSENTGPFEVRITITEIKTGLIYIWHQESWNLNSEVNKRKVFDLTNLKYPDNYVVEFYIDKKLAYASEYEYEPGDIPF